MEPESTAQLRPMPNREREDWKMEKYAELMDGLNLPHVRGSGGNWGALSPSLSRRRMVRAKMEQLDIDE